jgi:hypothetical protein
MRNLVDYFETLDSPIFVANGDSRFIAANTLARTLAGGNPSEIESWLIADSLDCVWADVYGGCGEAECCRACLIIHALTETIATGRAITRKPAYLDVQTENGVERQHYLISTLKAGEAVLLKMDRR